MLKLAVIVWIMLATTLAGIAVLVLLTLPWLATDPMRMIPVAAAGAAVLAMPLSFLIARRIQAETTR